MDIENRKPSKQQITAYCLIPKFVLKYGLFIMKLRPTTGRGFIVLPDSIPEHIIDSLDNKYRIPPVIYRRQFRTDRESAVSTAYKIVQDRIAELLDEVDRLNSLQIIDTQDKTADEEDLIL